MSRVSKGLAMPGSVGSWTTPRVLFLCLSLFALSLSCAGGRTDLKGEHGAYRFAEIPLGNIPDALAAGSGAIWVGVPGSFREIPTKPGWLLKIDPASNAIVSRIRVGKRPGDVVFADGAVWVLNTFGVFGQEGQTVMRVDPDTGEVTHAVPVPTSSYLAADDSGLWLVGSLGDVLRLDTKTMEVTRLTESGPSNFMDLSDVAAGASGLWLLEGNRFRFQFDHGNVYRFDPAAGGIAARGAVGSRPTELVLAEGSLWVVNSGSRGDRGSVMRLDPSSLAVEATIPVGRYPSFIAFCEGSVWVMNLGDGTLSRLDPERNGVVDTLGMPYLSRTMACGEGSLWITRETAKPSDGSLLRLYLR